MATLVAPGARSPSRVRALMAHIAFSGQTAAEAVVHNKLRAGLTSLGFNTGVSEGPITPVIVGDGALAMQLSDRLFQSGVFAFDAAAGTPKCAAAPTTSPSARSHRPRSDA